MSLEALSTRVTRLAQQLADLSKHHTSLLNKYMQDEERSREKIKTLEEKVKRCEDKIHQLERGRAVSATSSEQRRSVRGGEGSGGEVLDRMSTPELESSSEKTPSTKERSASPGEAEGRDRADMYMSTPED
ncbi:hypothetical protein BDV95DRAFT_607033 [Massariosphaeria phaeospora]|uniref:Uncharacterized protein n=1 Tax=Massariosphaeria phaeospora TaxID=100035 RepID=A0A7C8IFB4_9PLEO|nr:hypothetical protein BDV95DRAFT_607033 [Massariosphaeria phaeospora]